VHPIPGDDGHLHPELGVEPALQQLPVAWRPQASSILANSANMVVYYLSLNLRYCAKPSGSLQQILNRLGSHNHFALPFL
jgi:hypothetical protein